MLIHHESSDLLDERFRGAAVVGGRQPTPALLLRRWGGRPPPATKGLLLLWRWGRQWFERTQARPDARPRPSAFVRALLLLLLGVPALVSGLRAGWPALETSIGPVRIAQLFTGNAVIAGGQVLLVSTLVVAAAWQARQRMLA